jgi:membrane-bound lytic murein transglycosylase B
MRFTIFAALLAVTSLPSIADAACGGNFGTFLNGLKAEAPSHGIDKATAERFLHSVRADPAVLRADRSQGVFQRPFVDFSRRLISNDRINRGRSNGKRYNKTFNRVEQNYGVDRGVLLAFWAFETDFGAIQGNSTQPMHWSPLHMIAVALSCSALKFLPQWNCLSGANLTPPKPRAHGPAKSAWSRCYPMTFSKTALMAMAMATCL